MENKIDELKITLRITIRMIRLFDTMVLGMGVGNLSVIRERRIPHYDPGNQRLEIVTGRHQFYLFISLIIITISYPARTVLTMITIYII